MATVTCVCLYSISVTMDYRPFLGGLKQPPEFIQTLAKAIDLPPHIVHTGTRIELPEREFTIASISWNAAYRVTFVTFQGKYEQSDEEDGDFTFASLRQYAIEEANTLKDAGWRTYTGYDSLLVGNRANR